MFLWLCASILPVFAQQTDTPVEPVRFDAAHNTLSVDIERAPVGTVMQSVADKAGFELQFGADPQSPVSAKFDDLPLPQALKLLLGSISFVLLYDTPETGPRVLREVRVYSTTTGTSATPNVEVNEEWIIDQLVDQDPGKRVNAVRMTARLPEDVAARLLEQVLDSDEEVRVRMAAVEELTSIGGDDAIYGLEVGLNDDDVDVRAQVVRGLSRLGGEQAVMALGQVVIGDEDPQLRAMAVEALIAEPNEDTISFLEAALEDDDELVREAARSALELLR